MIDFKHEIIIESQNIIGTKIAAELAKSGIYAVTRPNVSEKTLEKNAAFIIDNTADNMEESVETLILSGKTGKKVLVLTGEDEPLIVNKNGILFVSEKLGTENICQLAEYCLNAENPRKQAEKAVFGMLVRMGFQTSHKGYRYLNEIIPAVSENPGLIYDFAYKLYRTVAEKYGVTPSSVERSVRHSIETAYYLNRRKFEEFFDCQFQKPTNAEFISFCAEKIRMDLL